MSRPSSHTTITHVGVWQSESGRTSRIVWPSPEGNLAVCGGGGVAGNNKQGRKRSLKRFQENTIMALSTEKT